MGLLEAMRQVQEWNLCVRPEDEEYLAKLFKTTRTHIHEVATFFPFFTQKPTGRRRVGLCHGISCAMAGSYKMASCLKISSASTNSRRLRTASFLGRDGMPGRLRPCASASVNEELVGKATEKAIDDLAAKR